MKPLQKVEPYSEKIYAEWKDKDMLGRDAYINVLLDSRFVPCPGGMNPETFRLYEALECGCIPLYVRQEGDEGFLKTLALPLLNLSSWERAADLIKQFNNEPATMEQYRGFLLTAWYEKRKALQKDIQTLFGL